MRLVLCPRCSRHIEASAPCPFCAASSPVPSPPPLGPDRSALPPPDRTPAAYTVRCSCGTRVEVTRATCPSCGQRLSGVVPTPQHAMIMAYGMAPIARPSRSLAWTAIALAALAIALAAAGWALFARGSAP